MPPHNWSKLCSLLTSPTPSPITCKFCFHRQRRNFNCRFSLPMKEENMVVVLEAAGYRFYPRTLDHMIRIWLGAYFVTLSMKLFYFCLLVFGHGKTGHRTFLREIMWRGEIDPSHGERHMLTQRPNQCPDCTRVKKLNTCTWVLQNRAVWTTDFWHTLDGLYPSHIVLKTVCFHPHNPTQQAT